MMPGDVEEDWWLVVRSVMALGSMALVFVWLHYEEHPAFGVPGTLVICALAGVFMFYIGYYIIDLADIILQLMFDLY